MSAIAGMNADEIERALLRQFPTMDRAKARRAARKQAGLPEDEPSDEQRVSAIALVLPITIMLPWSALCSDDRRYGAIIRRGADLEPKPLLVLQPQYREAKRKARQLAREVVGPRWPGLLVRGAEGQGAVGPQRHHPPAPGPAERARSRRVPDPRRGDRRPAFHIRGCTQ